MPGRLPELTDKEVISGPGFIKERNGQTMLMMSVAAYRRAFPDWRRLKATSRRFMEFDADNRHHPKQTVRRNGEKVRLMTFVID